MKIIFLEAVHNFGGSSKSTLELAKRLMDDGHQILIVDFWGCNNAYVNECEILGVPLKIIDSRNNPILLHAQSKIKTSLKHMGYLKTIREYRKKMNEIIDDYNPDVISVNSTKTLSILSRSNNYKIAYFARGWFLPSQVNFVDRKLLKKLVDIYLTVSQSTKQMVFASGFAPLKNIFVIQDAVDFNENQKLFDLNHALEPWYDSKEREFVLMHCGSFLDGKGQHIAVEVLKKLVGKNLNVKLLLVGLVSQGHKSREYYNYILELIKKYQLESKVEIILNEPDVLKYYTKADVLVHPSSTEGLPRVILEAMTFGKPVIANAVGGIIDCVSDKYTGFLTNFNVVDEYVHCIENLMYDKTLYKFISDNANELIQHSYSESNQIDAFKKMERVFISS